jgi:hypothetical protein
MNNSLMLGFSDVLLSLIDSFKGSMAIILAIGAIFLCLQCFFGYRIFKFWIGVQGFILFGIIGIVIVYLSFKGEVELTLILGLVLGVLGALLAMELYKIGVFLQCFWTGSIIGVLIGKLVELDMGQTVYISVSFGIILGIIGVILIKPIIILSTGISGGMSLGYIVAISSDQDILVAILLGIIVSMCGVLYQFYSEEQPQGSTIKQDESATAQNSESE